MDIIILCVPIPTVSTDLLLFSWSIITRISLASEERLNQSHNIAIENF